MLRHEPLKLGDPSRCDNAHGGATVGVVHLHSPWCPAVAASVLDLSYMHHAQCPRILSPLTRLVRPVPSP